MCVCVCVCVCIYNIVPQLLAIHQSVGNMTSPTLFKPLFS